MLCLLHYADARFGWWDDRATARAKARAHVERALELEPDNPDARARLSQVRLLQERWEAAAAEVLRAVRRAPDSGDIASVACFVLATAGAAEAGVAEGCRAMTLAPNPPGHYFGQLGNACRLAGRLDEAIAAFEAYHRRNPGFGLVDLVIVRAAAGQLDDARRTAAQLLSFRPGFTVAAWQKSQFRQDPARLEADLVALRAAGLPAG